MIVREPDWIGMDDIRDNAPVRNKDEVTGDEDLAESTMSIDDDDQVAQFSVNLLDKDKKNEPVKKMNFKPKPSKKQTKIDVKKSDIPMIEKVEKPKAVVVVTSELHESQYMPPKDSKPTPESAETKANTYKWAHANDAAAVV